MEGGRADLINVIVDIVARVAEHGECLGGLGSRHLTKRRDDEDIRHNLEIRLSVKTEPP